MEKPLITNEKAQREWNYLIKVAGEEKALNAIKSLPGKRRAYPSNIAKSLNIKFPPFECMDKTEDELLVLRERGRSELKRIRKNLKI